MADLLACPFCGGEASVGIQRATANRDGVLGAGSTVVDRYFINCILCGCSTSTTIPAATPEGAARNWNARAGSKP